MTTLNLGLPEAMKSFVDHEAARRGYESPAKYLQALIREEARRRAKEELEAKLLEGLEGESSPMTADDWKSLHEHVVRCSTGKRSK
jgi:antitoxin ParD1/3/4